MSSDGREYPKSQMSERAKIWIQFLEEHQETLRGKLIDNGWSEFWRQTETNSRLQANLKLSNCTFQRNKLVVFMINAGPA